MMRNALILVLLALLVPAGLSAQASLRPDALAFLYIDDDTGYTVNCAVSNQYYEISTGTVGVERVMDAQTDGDIDVASAAGVCFISYSISADGVSGHENEIDVFVNGSDAHIESRATMGTGNAHTCFAAAGYVSCPANAVVDLRARDVGDTGSFVIHRGTFTVKREAP